MAEKSGHDKPIDELRAEIARSRERVGRDLRGLHYELDLPAKLRRSFREQTVSWITAAAAVGALIAFAPMRKKKIYIDAKSGGKRKGKVGATRFYVWGLENAASPGAPAVGACVRKRRVGFGGGF